MTSDHLLNLEGKKVKAVIDGQPVRGRLISIRDNFLTIETKPGQRISLNKYEISSIQEEQRPVSRNPRLTRLFWR